MGCCGGATKKPAWIGFCLTKFSQAWDALTLATSASVALLIPEVIPDSILVGRGCIFYSYVGYFRSLNGCEA